MSLAKKYWIIFILLIVGVLTTYSSAFADEIENIKKYEDSLRLSFSEISVERNDLLKEKINEKILNYFRNALKIEDSFDYNFDSLKFAGIIKSDDEKLRIITWNLPYNDRTHKYFGFIQYKVSKKETITYELNDNSDEIKAPEFAILNHTNWFGALYYKIVENKYKGEVYYTLLGADLNDMLIKKKIIEILSFDRDDNPVFGKKVFKNRNQAVSRVIFEYSAQVNMALTYDQEKEMIIYDHLSPIKPSLEGQFEFYGPDFSYDGLKFERGIWNSYPDIDVRNYNIE